MQTPITGFKSARIHIDCYTVVAIGTSPVTWRIFIAYVVKIAAVIAPAQAVRLNRSSAAFLQIVTPAADGVQLVQRERLAILLPLAGDFFPEKRGALRGDLLTGLLYKLGRLPGALRSEELCFQFV